EAPFGRLQRELRRRKDVPEYIRTMEMGVKSVALVVGQTELTARVLPDAQNLAEFFLGGFVKAVVRSNVVDAAGLRIDFQVPVDGLGVVTEVGAGIERQRH